jgi:hypothetical protein
MHNRQHNHHRQRDQHHNHQQQQKHSLNTQINTCASRRPTEEKQKTNGTPSIKIIPSYPELISSVDGWDRGLDRLDEILAREGTDELRFVKSGSWSMTWDALHLCLSPLGNELSRVWDLDEFCELNDACDGASIAPSDLNSSKIFDSSESGFKPQAWRWDCESGGVDESEDADDIDGVWAREREEVALDDSWFEDGWVEEFDESEITGWVAAWGTTGGTLGCKTGATTGCITGWAAGCTTGCTTWGTAAPTGATPRPTCKRIRPTRRHK